MKNFYFITLLIIGLQFLSCSSKCSVSNIEVPETIIITSKENRINYCELLEKSLKKDRRAILELSLLDFDNSIGYEHGSILVDLIKAIGENEYIILIGQVNSKEKKKIEAYIEVGLMYHDDAKLKEKPIEKIFPELSVFLEK